MPNSIDNWLHLIPVVEIVAQWNAEQGLLIIMVGGTWGVTRGSI